MAQSKPSKIYRQLSLDLEAIILELQREDLDIDEALAGYDKGLAIVEQLEAYLQTAENKIRELKLKHANNGA